MSGDLLFCLGLGFGLYVGWCYGYIMRAIAEDADAGNLKRDDALLSLALLLASPLMGPEAAGSFVRSIRFALRRSTGEVRE